MTSKEGKEGKKEGSTGKILKKLHNRVETKHPGNERMQGRRRGNVLNYEGNICKQVIEALGRRLDKWRTVLLLFKRVTPTCE